MAETTISAADGRPHPDSAFLGHPRGLGYLAFTEAWERFSYYGMQSLLVLYMVGQLLRPGHVEHVAGFAPFRAAIERVYGPLSIQALASAIFGLYAGCVYLTPILGGLLADRLLGRTRTIMLGGVLMAAGHFLMAFDASFLAALSCLVLGAGCFKGNLASQVGALYAPGDLRRADAFQLYYLAVNAGVIAAPLACGTLGEILGWHYGFAAAGIGMLLALAIYARGLRYLPSDERREKAAHARLAPGEIGTIVLLIALLPVLAVAAVGNQEIFNAYLVWAKRTVDLRFFGRQLPISWLITLDAIVSVTFLAGVVAFWRLWARRFREPGELVKIAIGCATGALAMVVLALASAQAAASGAKVNVSWAIAFHVVNSIGFANIFPVSLALYARASPKAVAATLMGIFYFHLFAGNMLVGWLGGLLDRMPAVQFWLLHAGLVAATALIFALAHCFFGDRLEPED